MSVFRFSIELLIPIAATNLLPFTPFFGLEAQQIHSPLQKRLGTSTEMFLGLLLKWGRADQLSRHIKREKTSLPVDVRRTKASLLKLPIYNWLFFLCS